MMGGFKNRGKPSLIFVSDMDVNTRFKHHRSFKIQTTILGVSRERPIAVVQTWLLY